MDLFRDFQTTSSSVTSQVVDYIRNLILENKLSPGEKLPPEREMAQLLNVSRNTIREAYKILAAYRMIAIRHGQGVFVSDDFENTALNLLELQLTNGRTFELYEIRTIIEPQACMWAAERADEEMLNALEQNIKETEYQMKNKLDPNMYAEKDREFHMLIAQAAGNEVLIRIMTVIVEMLNEAVKNTYARPGRIPVSLEEHKTIAQAIIGNVPEEAHAAMLKHLHNSFRIVTDAKDK